MISDPESYYGMNLGNLVRIQDSNIIRASQKAYWLSIILYENLEILQFILWRQ